MNRKEPQPLHNGKNLSHVQDSRNKTVTTVKVTRPVPPPVPPAPKK